MGIPAASARTYAKTFVEESITKDSLTMIDREVHKELGVTTMGHALAILKLAKEQPYIHPVNGNGNRFLLVCQTTHKWTNIHHDCYIVKLATI